nr:hypothetical protein [Hymenobacter cyanobacteriorum]
MFIKRLLLMLLLALVLLPALQAKLHFFEEKALAGAFTVAPHAEFSWEALRDNSFQTALEHYLEDRIGFRTYLIRLRNQLSFSLFRAVRSSDLLVGEHGVLFQPGPIESYLGHDLLAEDEVRFRVARLHAVQRDLSRHGVHMVYVLAPGKARFQPEDLPARLRAAPGTITNYDRFVHAMLADSVSLLNLTPVFARWKHTKPYRLFPSGGTHWSGYGATLAADTLLRYLEHIGQVRFPAVRTVAPPHLIYNPDSLKGTDNDLGWTLNLIWPRDVKPLAYRRLAFGPPQPGQTRPSALFVGDSFAWGLMLFSPYMQREFSDDTRFWYYSDAVHLPDSVYHDTGIKASTLDLKQQIESRQFIVLLFTEHNLGGKEYGFTDRVYHLYHPLTPADQAAINRIAQQLVAKASWEEQTKDLDGFKYRAHEQAHDLYERQQYRAALQGQ